MKKSLADTVMETINKDRIAVRSGFSVTAGKIFRWSILTGNGMFLTVITGTLILWLADNYDLATSYGRYGLWSLAETFPYLTVLIFLISGFAVILFLRMHDFSYRRPLGVLTGIFFFSAVVLGVLLPYLPAGRSVLAAASQLLIPETSAGRNFVAGVVIQNNPDNLELSTNNGRIVRVETKAATYPAGTPRPGDYVRNVGVWESGAFTAVGVKVMEKSGPANEDLPGPGGTNRDGPASGSAEPTDPATRPALTQPDIRKTPGAGKNSPGPSGTAGSANRH